MSLADRIDAAKKLIERAELQRRWDEFERRNAAMWIWGLIVGLAGAYAVIGFRLAIQSVQFVGFGEFSENLASAARDLHPLHIAVIPILGGVAVGALLWFGERRGWLPETRSYAVADVIEARALSGRIGLGPALYSAAITATSLGAGASAGREGPAVHLGAAFGSSFARWLGLPAREARTLLACGAAAAVAASFNAPIAGAVFALEVVLGHYALRVIAPVAAASTLGAVIARAHLGAQPAFLMPLIEPAGFLDYPAAALLGVIAAFAAIGFMRATLFSSTHVTRLAGDYDVPLWALPPIGGVAIGAIGVAFPQVLGVGYEATAIALDGGYGFWLLLALIGAKTAATAITLACRFGGGYFSPALYLGAMIGGAFGAAASLVMGGGAGDVSFFALVGMGAFSGAVLGAPLSTTLIVFELTSNYETAIAVLVAVSLATVIVQRYLGAGIFQLQIEKRGYALSEGPQRIILQTVRVRDFMTPIDRLQKENVLEGPHLYEDDNLGKALGFLEAEGVDGAPVKSRSGDEPVVGYITRSDALIAYNRRLVDEHRERAC